MHGTSNSSKSKEYILSEQDCVKFISLEKTCKDIYENDIFDRISMLIETIIANGKITNAEINELYKLLQIKSIDSFKDKYFKKDYWYEETKSKEESDSVDIHELHRKNLNEANFRFAVKQINDYKMWLKEILKLLNMSEIKIIKAINNDLRR
jgi:hypothetical protein